MHFLLSCLLCLSLSILYGLIFLNPSSGVTHHLFIFPSHAIVHLLLCLLHPTPSSLPPSASPCHLLARSLSQGSTNSNMLDVQGGAHKKRVRRSSLLNAKKLYEDAQMARKVKQYLSNLTVETDEEKHQIMSLQCEPSYSTCEWHRN